MAKIQLSSGFSIIPEGVYTFRISKINHEVDFGKLQITCETADGQEYVEKYTFLKSDGSANEGAIKAFSFFARRVLNDNTIEDVDPEEFVGHFFNARVEHKQTEKKDKPGEFWTNVSLQDVEVAYGFDGQDVPEAGYETIAPDGFDVDAILGL